MSKCIACGATLDEVQHFCPTCGKSVADELVDMSNPSLIDKDKDQKKDDKN